ncbi:nickel-dependent hydrogenase large subunit [Candidatus Albibeggiatoa sp. nov. NOAA]|uniref:Ni/Fe hydrogenase subunit alpha n=1 Tax=Candidatus Albibeggiatoa sp. nov. NOAA TaxID=3162724 RepID=UPI0032F0E82E|nr:nickel-dependent hydrogenase large subunit [Thiotrichaceae bacterium]
MSEQREIAINVPVLARVEGEGALDLSLKAGEISDLKLRIFEPPRYFEKFAEGRDYFEMPDLVARICGICPVAYQMSAVHALESILNIEATPWIRTMRRLLYCGEWIESHNLHIHLLAAPDFLGYGSAPELAKDHPEVVKRGVYLQELGNQIIKMLGGRSVHPVGARVGGFHQAPTVKQAKALLEKLEAALPQVEQLVEWAASLNLPDNPQQFNCVSVKHPDEYPMNEGNIVSSEGLDIPISEYNHHFREFHVPHSTALHSLLNDKPYLLGPLARVNLNFDLLPEPVKATLAKTKIQFPSNNMFHSIVARAAEVHYAFLEAIRILRDYTPTDTPFIPVDKTQAGTGFGCTEAPRGMLWHQWALDEQGRVTATQIVPPTSQNQAQIEQDLRFSLQQKGLDTEPDELRLYAETVIRNYDPCISCATHFLKLTIK